MNKTVSIILPVYNVEKYLDKCLKSLTNQTLMNIEIIVVNDGSTDKSQDIIDDYKNKYPNMIKAFYLEHKGVANARNYALNYVSGEYIGFVDSDDYISKEMYEKLYDKAKHENAPIVCCNFYRVSKDKHIKIAFGNENINKDEVFNKNIYESNLLFEEFPYVWNKIFKTDLIKQNRIDFDLNLRIYEDMFFTYKAFSKAEKISHIDEFLYFYRILRKGSLTNKFTEKRFDIFKLSESLIGYYKKIGKYEEVKEALVYVILKHIYIVFFYYRNVSPKRLKLQYIDKSFTMLNDEFVNWKDNMYFNLWNKNKKRYKYKIYWIYRVLLKEPIEAVTNKLKQKIKNKVKFYKNKLKNIIRRAEK